MLITTRKSQKKRTALFNNSLKKCFVKSVLVVAYELSVF